MPDEQIIETKRLCDGCLVGEHKLDQDYVERETREKRIVAAYLNAEGCPFSLRMVVGDGTCCFRVLFEFAVSKLGYDASFAVFVECLQGRLLKRLLRLHARLVKSGIESDSVAQLQRIKQSRNPVRDLQTGAWEYIEAEQVLRGFVQVFFLRR